MVSPFRNIIDKGLLFHIISSHPGKNNILFSSNKKKKVYPWQFKLFEPG